MGALSPKWDIVIPSGSRELCGWGSKKIVRARDEGWLQGNSTFPIQQDWYTEENSETESAHIGPAQLPAIWGQNTKREKWTWGPTPNQEATCNWYPLASRKAIFSNRVSLGISTTLQGRPHAQKQLTNTKLTHWYFRGLFVSFCLVWAMVFCLLVLIFEDFFER